jgi:hypothetical protein
MPRNNVRADSRFQKAVEYQINNPNLEVRDAMKLADFSLREREDKAKYVMAVCDPTTGKIHIPEDQLGNIGNFDETCLNLNGSSTNRGGRPEALIYDPRFPVVGKTTCTSSLTSTLITDSTAAGEAFPPHIQYVT